LRSGRAHCDLELVPTGIWSSRGRSGSAHWELDCEEEDEEEMEEEEENSSDKI
jgi:hypothetical protein